MKTIFKILLLLVVCVTGYTADNLIKPSYPGGMMYLKDATQSTIPAVVLYTTDGNSNLQTLGGITPVSDDIVKPSAPGGMLYLKDSTGKTLPAMVAFTTDGNGNVQPISGGGGGGGGSLTPGSVQNLSAGFTINSTSPYIPVTATGNVVSDPTTAISNGTADGQLLLIENRDATDYIEIAHGANTVMPGGARQRIYPLSAMMFVWNGTDWVAKSESANSANVATRIPIMTQIDRDTTYGAAFPPPVLVLNTTTRTLSLGGGPTWLEMNPNTTQFQFSSTTTPSGVTATSLRNIGGNPGAIFNSLQNVNLLLETANATGVASGNINLQTGTSDTTRGSVQILSPVYLSQSERVATRLDTTGAVTVSAETDNVILNNPGLPGPSSVTLPDCVNNGLKFVIKDASGTAALNNITISADISDTFEGGGFSLVINTNYGSRTIVCHNNVWYIIARSP